MYHITWDTQTRTTHLTVNQPLLMTFDECAVENGFFGNVCGYVLFDVDHYFRASNLKVLITANIQSSACVTFLSRFWERKRRCCGFFAHGHFPDPGHRSECFIYFHLTFSFRSSFSSLRYRCDNSQILHRKRRANHPFFFFAPSRWKR